MLSRFYLISICGLWFFQLLKPVYGMYFYPFFIFIRPDQWFEEFQEYRLAFITALILLFSCALRGITIKHRYIACAVLFVIAASLSLFFSAEITDQSQRFFIDLLKAMCLSLICFWTIQKRTQFVAFVKWMLLYITANGACAFYQIITKTGLDESGRSRGFMNDQNDTAGLMATSFALAFYFFRNEKNQFFKLFYFICFFFIIFGLYGTVSRGGLITLTFSLILIYTKNIKNIVATCLVAMLFTGFFYFAKDLYMSRETVTTTMTGKTYLDSSSRKRIELITTALKIWEQNPVWGIGMGNFETAIIDGKKVTRNAHNAYLQILAEMGIVGLCAFLYLLKVSFTTIKNIAIEDPFYRDMALCCRISLLSWMLFFLFAHSYLHAIFWLYLVFPFILEKISFEEKKLAPTTITERSSKPLPIRKA